MQQQILLIDDTKAIHALVTALLGEDQVTIHSAYDAQFGLILAASLRPDLILLDVEMPGVDGYETCRRLKADPATASLPIIFLTARATTEEIVRGLELGANDYVTKPFKLSELQSRVHAVLRTSHLIRLLESKALIDSLTGLGNRAMFDKRFAAEVGLRARSGGSLSCIALEVDSFKHILQSYGLIFANYVLTKIGETLAETCRAEDVACRHNGPGFVVLTPQTSSEQAAVLAGQMRIAIEKIPFTHQGRSVAVTCSFGVAEATDVYDRLVLDRAEQAIHHANEQGRNRIMLAPGQPVPVAVAA